MEGSLLALTGEAGVQQEASPGGLSVISGQHAAGLGARRGDRKEGRSREIGLEIEPQVRFCLTVLSKQEQRLNREVKTRKDVTF